MMLTAAKFYATPTIPNARLLFRASLLHLPVFMAAFLLHRLPNTGEDRAQLLAHNVRLLGLGAPLASEERAVAGSSGWGAEEEAAAPLAAGALARVRLSFPPLPFLGALPLGLELSCPSKASCEEGESSAATALEQQQAEGEGKGEEGGKGAPVAGQA